METGKTIGASLVFSLVFPLYLPCFSLVSPLFSCPCPGTLASGHAPDNDAVLRSHIHAIAGLDVIGLLELRELGDDYVDAQMFHGVGVDAVFFLQSALCHFTASQPGVGAEKRIVVETLRLFRNAQDAGHTAQVGGGLFLDFFSGTGGSVLPGVQAVVIGDQLSGAKRKGLTVGVGPPVPQRTGLVELGTPGIKGMGDLMGNDRAYARQGSP